MGAVVADSAVGSDLPCRYLGSAGGADLTGDEDQGSSGVRNFFEGEAHNAVLANRIEQVNFYSGRPPEERETSGVMYALPAAAGAFCNRGAQLAQTTAAVTAPRSAGRPAVVIVSGLHGVGKTAMAVEWALQQRGRFPDGVLYRELGGLGHRDRVGLRDTVIALLRQMGVSGEGLPTSEEDLLEVFRSRLADRKVLLVLDNVRYPRAVGRLMPPSEHCAVLVLTDRDPAVLAGMYDAEVIRLGALSEKSSLGLLRSLAGRERVDREIDGARAIVGVCGGWPIAIRVAAGRLKTRPKLRLTDLAERLQNAYQRPHLMPGEEWAVQVVGDDAYEEMPAEIRRAFRLLALHPGSDDRPTMPAGRGVGGSAVGIGIGAAAAVFDTDESMAAVLIDPLIDRNLVDEREGRYSMHDLVRVHARRLAEREESVEDQDAAVRRVIEWYLRSAALADLAVNSYRPTSGPIYQRLRAGESAFGMGPGAAQQGLVWLETEHRNLCAMVYAAADRGWNDLVWQLCEALWGLFFSLKHYDLWIATHQVGLEAAKHLDSPDAFFRVGIQLARALYETGNYANAHEVLDETLDVVDQTADGPLNRATVLEFKGRVHLDAGEPAIALELFRRAKGLEEVHGRTRGVAINLHHLGRTYLALGDHVSASAALVEARRLFTELSDVYNEGRVLTTLGRLHQEEHRPQQAAETLNRALEIMLNEGRTYQVALISESLAAVADSTGDRDRARELRTAAVSAYERVGSIRAVKLREEYPDDTPAGSA